MHSFTRYISLTVASSIKMYGSFIIESGYPGKPEMDTNQLKTDFVDIGCDVSYHKDLHGDVSPHSPENLNPLSLNLRFVLYVVAVKPYIVLSFWI